MEMCEYVRICDSFGHPTLKEKSNIGYGLKEVIGTITFCEVESHQEISSLIMKLEEPNKIVSWDYEAQTSLPALVGQTLRGFYEEEIGGRLKLLAYELIEKNKVLRRGTTENCSFERTL